MMKNKSMALIAVIFLMLVSSLLAVTAFSLLAAGAVKGTWQATEAYALSLGGKEWYLKQLTGDSDWSNQTSQSGVVLGNGTFDIAINSASAGSVNFTVTGKRAGVAGQTAQRKVTVTAKQLPKAAQFALFWGNDNGDLSVSSSTISGDVWSAGDAAFSSSTVNGTVYHPAARTVSGATEVALPAPTPAMPVIGAAYYTGLETIWNGYIPGGNVGQSGGSDITLSSDQTWTGAINSYRDITTNGFNITCNNCAIRARNLYLTGDSIFGGTNPAVNLRQALTMRNTASINATNFTIRLNGKFITNNTNPSTNSISGSGTIGSNQNGAAAINLCGTSGGTRSLTVTPSGGNIVFSSRVGITISSSTATTLNSGVNLYSRGESNERIYINNANTTVNGAVIFGNRAITVRSGADVLNSVLFVDYPGTGTNNVLTITDSGTTVGNSGIGPCTVISMGRADPSLFIASSAVVRGLVYQYDAANSGSLRLGNSAVVTGAAIANEIYGPSFSSAALTYDASAIPSPPPAGFAGFASVSVDTWDDK